VTLGCSAQINRESIVEPSQNSGLGHIVGCLDDFKGGSAGSDFIRKYPQHPTVDIESIENLPLFLGEEDRVVFYYSILPSDQRNTNSVQLLKRFPNSILLIEKPSQLNYKKALEFKALLQQEGVDSNRVVVGMHSPIHPAQKCLMELIREVKNEIVHIDCHFNYPKNPHDPSSYRVYDKDCGGAMLDLGVYVYNMVKEIGQIVGFKLSDFDHSNKEVWLKRDANGVDIESIATLSYMDGRIGARMETKINPGSNHSEELKVTLKNGDKIVCNQFAHWHDSCGVFIEHTDGSVTNFPESQNPKSTYQFQFEHIHQLISSGQDGHFEVDKSLKLENQIELLEFIDILRNM